MAREKRTFKSASYFYFFNAGFDFPSTFPAADLLSTCYKYAVYMMTIHLYHMMM